MVRFAICRHGQMSSAVRPSPSQEESFGSAAQAARRVEIVFQK